MASSQVSSAQRSPDSVYQLIRRDKKIIIQNWLKRIHQKIPSSRQKDNPALLDALPDFLENLAQTLETNTTKVNLSEYAIISKEHGKQRAQIGDYTIQQLLLEYHLLRVVLFEHLRAQIPLTVSEETIILDAIDHGVRNAGSEFSNFSENKLRKKVQILEEERNLREQFVLTLTHDMRSPLSAAKACAEIIIKPHRVFVSTTILASRIIESIDRTERMIRDLLDANQIRAGKHLPLTLEYCDLRAATLDTVAELTTIHGDRFDVQCESSLEGFWSCDHLRRAIENLAHNAVKYGDPHAAITITLQDRGDYARVSVMNRGNPISPEEQFKLFKPFERSQAALESGKRGWGLGLILVQGIAKAHGGTVHLESSSEKGTTFRIDLPKDARPFQLSHSA